MKSMISSRGVTRTFLIMCAFYKETLSMFTEGVLQGSAVSHNVVTGVMMPSAQIYRIHLCGKVGGA